MQSHPSSGDKSLPNSSTPGTGSKGRSENATRAENVGESHRFEAAADVVAQRVKALGRAAVDGHWSSAQFLELIPPDSSTRKGRRSLPGKGIFARAKRLGSYDHGTWQQKGPGKGTGKEEKSGKDGKRKGGKKSQEEGKKKGPPK